MTIVWHELKQNRISFLIWTAAIGFLLAVCIFMFPEMTGQMDEMNEIFGSMGSFTEAFGMDQVSFGTLTGFYAVECGNILGLGGAFFASLSAAGILAKEEKDHTAEFLLAHPVSRFRIVTEKLAAVLIQIAALNLVVYALAAVSIVLAGETAPWRELSLLHTAYFLLQIEFAGICSGVSAFLRRGSIGIGLGMAMLMYFFHLIANISDNADFLEYLTPFGYADGAEIVANLTLDKTLLFTGMVIAAAGFVTAYVKFCRKDIA